MVTFKQDGKCELPIRNLSLDDKAYWEVQEVNNIAVLSITGSKDTLFNRDFSFYLDKRKQGQATVDILELKSGNLFWKCSR